MKVIEIIREELETSLKRLSSPSEGSLWRHKSQETA
jgi:hypothetical protein